MSQSLAFPTDSEDTCCICDTNETIYSKLIKCTNCKHWIHMKCNKSTKKQFAYFLEHPGEFECRSCCTCTICHKLVAKNHQGIVCNTCNKWIHTKCNKLGPKDFSAHQDNETLPFCCMNCLKETLPALGLNNNEFLLTMEGIDYPEEINVNEFYPSESQIDMINKINQVIAQGFNFDNKDDENDIEMTNCKYYTTELFNKQKFCAGKSFTILHLNIHSVELHIEELRVALQLINLKFDIICLTESKIRSNEIPKTDINIVGYQPPIGMGTEAAKGGVLIYVKDDINYMPRDDLNMHKPKELESFFIEIINARGKNTLLGTIYRHPCMDQNTFIDDYIKPLNDKLIAENKKTFIAGDFNFDLLNTSNNETLNFFETMMSSFLLPVITIPTKINKQRHTVIDNIFTNQIHPEMKSGNITLAISDHLPSFLIVPNDNQNHIPKKQNLYTRKTKNFDKTNFILDYLEIDWDNILKLDNNDVNTSISIFLEKITELLDKYMPLRKITQSEFKRRFKPWISDEILSKINLKNKTFKKYMNCKGEQQIRKERLFAEYKILKNEITTLTRRNKKDYYDQYFSENKKNLQKTWDGIKEIINIKSKNYRQPTCITDNNKSVTDPKDISDSFNKYYTTIADDILAKRKYGGNKSHKDYLHNPLPNSFVIFECDQKEIEELISLNNGRKASGPNSIPTDILKLLKTDISIPLSKIFNISLKTGVYPDLFKIAKAIPIFKKGSPLEMSNYRPISLLSNLNKMLEKLMFNRIYRFLDKYDCLYKFQFGFRKKYSTNHALIKITETIRKALDDNQFACGIFIDLQKAFDTVNHSILIDKLHHYGIRNIANTWFKSYLSNRSQFVSIQGFDSKLIPIIHGVPQGSVLGPLLFLIYINDLHYSINHCSVYHFADDTNLLSINNSLKQAQKHINIDLKSVYKWLLANKSSLNCTKTELILFHKPGFSHKFNFKIKINGHRIYPSDSIKYLGIYMDSTLSGKAHCEVLVTKLRRANGMLSKVRHYVSKEELKAIYHAIFSSHLSYGSQIWSPKNTNVEKVCKLQNRALRIINFEDFRADPNPLYKRSNLLKLHDMVKLQNILHVYDYLNKSLPDCFQDEFFQLQEVYSSIQTRNSNIGCLYIPRRKTTKYGLNCITQQCIYNWNMVSRQLKTNLLHLSRSKLKTLLTTQFINSY